MTDMTRHKVIKKRMAQSKLNMAGMHNLMRAMHEAMKLIRGGYTEAAYDELETALLKLDEKPQI